jgi:hypothetical protein
MKDIFIVDSYAKSSEQLELLASMVNHLTRANWGICLVSHLPIPERLITPNVKFTIFDSNNILGRFNTMAVARFQDLALRFTPTESYHGAAVYTNLFNALRMLAGRYDWVHFVEYDLDIADIQKHISEGFARLKNQGNLKVIGYRYELTSQVIRSRAMMTNLISLRPEIVDVLPQVSCWNDYYHLGRGCAKNLESWLLEQLRSRGIAGVFLSPIQVANKLHNEGDYFLVKCRQYDCLFTVVIFNQSNRDVDATSNSGAHTRVENGKMVCLHDLPSSDEVVVTYVDTQSVFRHPLEAMPTGAFKRTGFNLCPDWTD